MTPRKVANFYLMRQKVLEGGGGLLDKARHLANIEQLEDEAEMDKPRSWTVGDVVRGAVGAALGRGFAKGIGRAFGVGDRFADKLETIGMGVGAAMNTGIIKSSQVEQLKTLRKHAFRIGAVKGLADGGYFAKEAVVKKTEGGKYELRTKDGKRTLGTHDSAQDAYKQEYAIQKSEERRGKEASVTEDELNEAVADFGQWEDRFEKSAAVMPYPVIDPSGLINIPRGIGRAMIDTGGVVGSAASQFGTADESDVEIAKLQVQKELLEEQLEKLKADRRNVALRKLLAKRKK